MRLLISPVCPQRTSATPTYKGESWRGLKPLVPGRLSGSGQGGPTFPQQGEPGCEVGLVPRALKKKATKMGRETDS